MTATASKILEDARRLPDNDRAALMARLMESLDPGEDEGVEATWRAEIQRRLEALGHGTVRLIPWSEVRF